MTRAIRGLLAVLAALGCALVATAPAQASLSVPTGGPPVTFSGSGASTANALASFEAAVGGRDNGTTAGEQGSGFRHLTWDAFPANGSDPTSRTIESGHVVGLGPGRLEPWGIDQGPGIGVANDGFSSANGNVAFTPFTPPNVWAPYNSNTAEFEVVAPAASGSVPAPAQTRGLGVVLLDVTTSNSTVQFYNGDILLDQLTAPVGATSFVGLLYPNPVVTRVVITLGTAQIFAFDGTTVTPTPSATDFVAGDDVALAEPAPAIGALTATAGVPVTAPLDTFVETTPGATIKAVIDWGDGTRTGGAIRAGSGGTLVVTGNHAYAQTGTYTAQVTVDDFGGPEQTKQTDIVVGSRPTTTSVTCSPSPVAVSASATCTVIVADAGGVGATSPGGLVAFSTTTPGASFTQDTGCLLGASVVAGVSTCAVQFTPGQIPPNQARISAAYAGDPAHAASGTTAFIGVRPQRCSLKALSRKLSSAGLGVLVTCDARANVQIAVKAFAARHLKSRAFSLPFGTLKPTAVAAGRPTVLVVRPAPGVLRSLRAALRRHQRVSLKLTLTATSRGATRTTTTRVAAVRLG